MICITDQTQWARDIVDSPQVRNPGALAAIRLHTEVIKHNLDSGDIPALAKVITRVYINGSGHDNTAKKTVPFRKQQALLGPFRVQFTEAIPLFDFVDVGHGKEKADTKIRGSVSFPTARTAC